MTDVVISVYQLGLICFRKGNALFPFGSNVFSLQGENYVKSIIGS